MSAVLCLFQVFIQCKKQIATVLSSNVLESNHKLTKNSLVREKVLVTAAEL